MSDAAKVCAAALTLACALTMLCGVHHVSEGSVGIYMFGGALQDALADPGYHLMNPITTTMHQVPLYVKTTTVRDIQCGTAGGVVVYFDKVEVVHRLQRHAVLGTVRKYSVDYHKTWIRDRLHAEVNQLCSAHDLSEIYITKFDSLDEKLMLRLRSVLEVWVPGLEVVAVRVTKPSIPEAIRRNYERMEAETSRLLVVTQKQKNVLKKAETRRRAAVMQAEKVKEVALVNATRQIEAFKSRAEMAAIEDQTIYKREVGRADAFAYAAEKEISTNQRRLTPEFLDYLRAQSQYANTKMYLGDSTPTAVIEELDAGQPVQQADSTLHAAAKRV